MDLYMRMVTKSPEMGPLLIFSVSLAVTLEAPQLDRMSMVMPIQIRIRIRIKTMRTLPRVLHLLKNQIFFYFKSQHYRFTIFLISVKYCTRYFIIFNILDSTAYWNFQEKSLQYQPFHLLEIDTDPDRHSLFRSGSKSGEMMRIRPDPYLDLKHCLDIMQNWWCTYLGFR